MAAPIGKYKLVRLIAAGGMAEVYLARQAGAAGFEKLVCLKRILPHLARDKQFVEMFLNEARLAAQLDHPNIVSIFDLGEASGNYFIAMEFIDGPSLRAVAKRAHDRGERLPIAEVVKIVSMAAGGLHYAHELTDAQGRPLGLVHRDISPDNILVHRNGAAKVVDFGIAKAANSAGMTRTGALKGKVAYMPPEQLRGEPLDRRADVFALGVVLYELLAGKRPWEGDSDVALIGRIMTQNPEPLRNLRPDVPPALLAIVDRALAKDRAARFQSCHEMQCELEALLVAMGKTITPARLSDFVRAWSDPPSPAPDDLSTSAALQALEAEMNGTTGAAPRIVRSRPGPAPAPREPTVFLPQRQSAAKGRGVAAGITAFLVVTTAGGAAGYWFLVRGVPLSAVPVQVERTAIVEPPPAKPPDPPQPVVMAPETPKQPDPAPIPPPPVTPPPAAAAAPPPAAPAPEPSPAKEPAAAAAPRPRPRKPVAETEESDDDDEPAAPVGRGELKLFVRPWARVEVDGQEVGVTPLAPISLSAGEHRVRLVNPELDKDITRVVRISPSETQTLKELLDE